MREKLGRETGVGTVLAGPGVLDWECLRIKGPHVRKAHKDSNR